MKEPNERAGIRRSYIDPLKGWAKIRNAWARDARLDWGALGLLAYLTTHAEGFEIALTELYGARRSKRHKVEAWLEELERAGYLERETLRRGGVITGTAWHLLDPNVEEQHEVERWK